MGKCVFSTSTALCIWLSSIIIAFPQEDMKYIDNTVFEHARRPMVQFEHDAHNEKAAIEDCNQCHHVYRDGVLVEDESSEDQRCSDCHLEKQANPLPLMKAFHLNCKGCHEEQQAGPVMCGECHQKN
ncbi:MAG: acidic tetraheme cytochrome c3 TmcA [Thermodesulfobacteriota bacterium]